MDAKSPYEKNDLVDKFEEVEHQENTKSELGNEVRGRHGLVGLEFSSGDPIPEDPELKAKETRQLTIRSVVIGTFFGLLMGAGNIYIALKIGWSLGAGTFAAFASFALLKAMEKRLPANWGGGYFGPKENVSCQSAANGAASGYGPFAAAVPAMYLLQLLSTPQADFAKLVGLGIVCAFYGTFFAVPLRKFYILQQKLIFPDAVCTAVAIRTLHTSPKIAKKQMVCLGLSFLAAFVWNIVRDYAPGILREWHFFWWISLFAGPTILAGENWGWGTVDTTPAFFGLGVIAGLNASLSFYGGNILAWGILGPITVATGLTNGQELGPHHFQYLSSKKGTPRYWLLWPGVFIMLCASLAEIAFNYKPIFGGIKIACKDVYNFIRRRPNSGETSIPDPATPAEQVPFWAWGVGLIASIVLSIVLLKVQFKVSPGHTIIAIVLAFILALIGIQSSGTIGINPIGPVAKCSQLVIGGVSKGQGLEIKPAQTVNLIAGSLAGQAAGHSVDMVLDLKIGHLLSATPKGQFWAQFWGTVCTVVPLTGVFIVYSKAYPCIVDSNVEPCQFGMPAVQAWKAVAIAMTDTDNPIPLSSGICALVLGALAIITLFIKHRLPAKYVPYVPNWMAIGVGLTTPNVPLAWAMVNGAVAAWLVRKYKPDLFHQYGYPFAAGFSAGEAISGIVNACLTLANIGGTEVGSTIGCPWGSC